MGPPGSLPHVFPAALLELAPVLPLRALGAVGGEGKVMGCPEQWEGSEPPPASRSGPALRGHGVSGQEQGDRGGRHSSAAWGIPSREKWTPAWMDLPKCVFP